MDGSHTPAVPAAMMLHCSPAMHPQSSVLPAQPLNSSMPHSAGYRLSQVPGTHDPVPEPPDPDPVTSATHTPPEHVSPPGQSATEVHLISSPGTEMHSACVTHTP
jgi:hypothetical protein